MSIRKPYHLLLLAAVSLSISALFSVEETIDFHFHDTYFVVAHSSFDWILATLSYFLWGIYFLARKVLLSNTLTLLHVVPTLLAIALFVCLPFFSYRGRYVELSPYSAFNNFHKATQLVAASAIVFIIAQLFFVVNIFGGVFNWLKKK